MQAMFQSTPANFTAGDATMLGITDADIAFQSTPANFTAGDPCRAATPRHPWRFNPRPPISQRATGPGISQFGVTKLVSIHARQFHSGRRSCCRPRSARRSCFNPRPPISQRATARRWPLRCCRHRFQSTPANFTAGDSSSPPGSRRCEGVSIHARQFHSGRLIDAAEWRARRWVSIHARQFHSGRPFAAGRA